MHDEAHDGFEMVSVEGHLTLLGHVHPASVPGPATAANAFHPLASVGRLERVNAAGEAGEDVRGDHLQQSRVGSPDLSPRVTQPHQTLWHTPSVKDDTYCTCTCTLYIVHACAVILEVLIQICYLTNKYVWDTCVNLCAVQHISLHDDTVTDELALKEGLEHCCILQTNGVLPREA